MTVLSIGNRNQEGTLEIADTSWDFNGTMTVTVRELYGHGCWSISKSRQTAAARRFARRAIHHPELTRSSRLLRAYNDGVCDYWTFAVSRHAL